MSAGAFLQLEGGLIMAIGNKLFALAEREFKQTRAAPVKREKFRAMNLNIGRYDATWDRKRGAAVRMMSVILRQDDEALLDRVSADAETIKLYNDAADWFRREATYLRKTATMLDTAATRLTTVLERQRASQPAVS
jgi:hypothetical protein